MPNEYTTVRIVDIDLDDKTFMSRLGLARQYISELADDIAERGQRNPIGLRPKNGKYQIIYGWERTLAINILGRDTIKATIYEGISDLDAQLHNISDNIRHKELTPLEIAYQVKRLREKYSLSVPEIAEFYGDKTQYIYDLLTLTKMSEEIRDAVHSGQIGLTHAIEINKFRKPKQLDILQKAINEGFSVSRIKQIRKGTVKVPKILIEDLAQKITESNKSGEEITIDQLERLAYELEFNRLQRFIGTQVCPQNELKPNFTREGVAKTYVNAVRSIAKRENWNLPTLSERTNNIIYNNVLARNRGCPEAKDYNFDVYPGTKKEFGERVVDWDRYVCSGFRTDKLSHDMLIWHIKEICHESFLQCGRHEFLTDSNGESGCLNCGMVESYEYRWEDPPYEAPPVSSQLENSPIAGANAE